jgi:hypothetical protein
MLDGICDHICVQKHQRLRLPDFCKSSFSCPPPFICLTALHWKAGILVSGFLLGFSYDLVTLNNAHRENDPHHPFFGQARKISRNSYPPFMEA